MYSFIYKYKKYLVGAVVSLFLFFSLTLYVGRKESAAYSKGFQSANTQWESKGKEYVSIIERGLEKNKDLNNKLMIASEEKRKIEESKSNHIKNLQLEYNKTKESSMVCIDDKLVDLYNNSLVSK